MNTKDFHKSYAIDRSAKVPKATPKVVEPEPAPAMIADGSSYRDGQMYFFFDRQNQTVRSSEGLRRSGAEHLGGSGLNVVHIGDLHERRSDAIDAAQKYLLGEIERLRDRIVELEDTKPKGERSLKRILQARGM